MSAPQPLQIGTTASGKSSATPVQAAPRAGNAQLTAALAKAPQVLERLLNRGPRYTSYPPATAWHEGVGDADLRRALADQPADAELSAYVHLPFCPSHCWFCACNVLITQRTDLQDAYLDHVEHELRTLAPLLPSERKTVQIHWGGGSPSQLSPQQMVRLMTMLRGAFDLQQGAEVAIEVDPRITTLAHLETLRELGFTRLSMGVQDVDPGVQKLINRIQPAELTANFVAQCRQLGFRSLNIDLIYGLPGQTASSLDQTLDAVRAMRPERLAVYGYAHVPWQKPQQKRMDESLIPTGHSRFALFEQMLHGLLDAGYRYIGLDHFALPDDELSRAQDDGTLQRNFMGYSTFAGTQLVGLGLSSIGLVGGTYVQNQRKLKSYQSAADTDLLPIERGYVRTQDDALRDAVIQRLLCLTRVDLDAEASVFGVNAADYFAPELQALAPLEADGLVTREGHVLQLTPLGQVLARPVAMVFDAHLAQATAQGARFSAV